MSIDQVIEAIEAATIKLPKPLSLAETEGLIEYLSKQLPADIHYQTICDSSFYIHWPDGAQSIFKVDGAVKLAANINSHKSGAFGYFRCEPDGFKKDSKISMIEFSTVPAWKLRDYSNEVVELWREVRGLITQYFEKEYINKQPPPDSDS